MAKPEKKNLADELSGLFGSNGFIARTTTTKTDGDFYVIKFITDSIFSALVMNNNVADQGDTLVGATFKAGDSLPNALGITSFTLASGSVIAYNR